MVVWLIILIITVIMIYCLYKNSDKVFEVYHWLAIKYVIWRAQRALRKINKGNIADAIRFDDKWED